MFESFKRLFLRRANPWRMSRAWRGDSQAAVGISLLRLAAVAQRERMKLFPLVEKLSQEHRGRSRKRLERLAARLRAGDSFVEALEQTSGLLTDPQILSLRFASQSGTLAQTYQELIDSSMAATFDSDAVVRRALSYAGALSLAFLLGLLFLMTFITPTFRAMFREFGMSLPLLLRALMTTTEAVFQYLPWVLLLVMCVAIVGWFFKPARIWHRWLAPQLLPWVASSRRSHLLHMLAQGVEAGRPLAASLSTLARYHFDRGIRMKLLTARNEIEQGTDAWESLEDVSLLNSAASDALRKASNSSLCGWMIRRLASQQETSIEQRHALWARLVHPMVILVFGVLTLWITLAFFSVLIAMIQSLA